MRALPRSQVRPRSGRGLLRPCRNHAQHRHHGERYRFAVARGRDCLSPPADIGHQRPDQETASSCPAQADAADQAVSPGCSPESRGRRCRTLSPGGCAAKGERSESQSVEGLENQPCPGARRTRERLLSFCRRRRPARARSIHVGPRRHHGSAQGPGRTDRPVEPDSSGTETKRRHNL